MLIRDQNNTDPKIIVIKLQNTLIKNAEVFPGNPGCMKGTEIVLNMKDNNVFLEKSYTVPYTKRKAVEAVLH